MQAFFSNIKEIIKIKENFPSLLSKTIKEVYKVINKLRKEKPRINMTFKRPSRRQVLVSMSLSNLMKFIVLSCKHIVNINRILKTLSLTL